MLITLPGSWARRSRGSDFGDKSSSLGSQLSASMWKRSENPMTKKKTSLSIIKYCLAICKFTNIPIFAIYIYGISHHVCLLIHVQRASLKHTWPPTKEGQSNKVQKPNRTIPLHSISLPLLSQEVNSEGRNNVHFIKLHAPWPLLCRYTGRLLSGNVVPCTNALDHGLFCVVEVGS